MKYPVHRIHYNKLLEIVSRIFEPLYNDGRAAGKI